MRDVGLSTCCGGIVGMGETRRDRAGLLAQLANLPAHPDSLPINDLMPIPGTPLGDAAPASRWTPSRRARPATLPPVQYRAGSILRKVTQVGDVYWRGRRILVGRSLERQTVRIEDRGHEIAIYYGWKQIRVLSPDQLGSARSYQLI